MIRKIKIVIAIVIIIFTYKPLIAENPVNPKLNLVPGENYICTKEQIMEQNLLIIWNYKILSKNDAGEYEISAKYSRIKSSQKFGMQKVEFDSDSPSDYVDPSMIGYKVLVGTELRMDITPDGNVKRLSGFEETIDKIIDNLNIPESPQRLATRLCVNLLSR